jgi:AcrR family transcriptional regulator
MPLPFTPARRREATRRSLLAAATVVFAEHGFHGASLDQVARAAGFTKGAVYSNFESKDDLFLALLEERAQQEMAALRRAVDRSSVPPEHRLSDFLAFFDDDRPGESAWRALYLEFCLYALRHPPAAAKLAAIDRAVVASIAEMIEERRVTDLAGTPADPQRSDAPSAEAEPAERLAKVVVAMFHGVGLLQALDPVSADQEFLRAAVAFAVRGLVTPPPGN